MLANIVWMCVGARLKVAYVNRWTLACACCGVIVEGNRLRGLLPPLPLLSGNICSDEVVRDFLALLPFPNAKITTGFL